MLQSGESGGARSTADRLPSSAPILRVHPTRRCNLACAHCYASSGPGARQALGLGLLSTCLGDAVALGYRHLAVSGGEPLLYDGLAELLARARSLGMYTHITSNGILATADVWDRVAPLVDFAAISIDGTPSEHDALRRRTGAFVTTVRNLQAIRASGVPFGIVFTLTQHNVDSLDFVVHLASHYGAHSVQVRPLTLHGRGVLEVADAQPSSIELGLALLDAARLGRELGVAVHVDAIGTDDLRRQRAAHVPARPAELTAVAPVLVVDADATVVPLSHEVSPRFWLGSLEHDRLGALARDWLRAGRGEALADICARTWTELTATSTRATVHWCEEVAARTRKPAATLRPALRACV